MKKLITVLSSAVVAFVAFGEPETADFEYQGYVVSNPFRVGNDRNEMTEPYTWDSADINGQPGIIASHGGDGSVNVPVPVDKRPDKSRGNNTKYLALDTATPLYRTFNTNSHTLEFTGEPIPANGIYLDMLVRFTASEDEFTADALANGDKIAIAYVEHATETEMVPVDPDNEDGEKQEQIIPDSGFTNFVIRAGYITSNDVLQKNYKAAVPEGFDKNAWHRLTVRTIKGIAGVDQVGFVVYVDQEPLAYSLDESAGDESFAAANVAGNFYNDSVHALYPSAVQTGTDATQVAAASFTGTGSLDDIVLTTDIPDFIKAGDVVPVTITLGVGVTGAVVKLDGQEYAPISTEGKKLVFNLPSGTTSFTFTPVIDTDNGFSFKELAGNVILADDTITWESGVPTFTVLATRNNVLLSTEDGDYEYVSFSEALGSAEEGSVIKLLWDYNVSDFEADDFTTFVVDPNVNVSDLTIDLNGKVITGGVAGEQEALFYVKEDAILKVIDSSITNTGKIAYTGGYAAFDAEGDVVIGADAGDYGPAIDGPVLNDEVGQNVKLIRGKVDAANNSDNEAFRWTANLDDNAKAELVGQYWYIVPGEEELPTFYALTVPEVEGATAAVTVGGAAVVDITAIKAGTVVLVKWTADAGYTIIFGETETITMDGDKRAAEPEVSEVVDDDYPEYIAQDDATIKAQYDAWKETYGADTESAFGPAFLLNVDPDAADTDLDVVSIELKDGKVTISADHDLSKVNGYLYIQSADKLEDLGDAPKVALETDEDGNVVLDKDEASSKFYQIGISYTPVN